MSADFLVGETLGDGAVRLTEHLIGEGSQRLYRGEGPRSSGERYVVSIILAPRGVPADELRRSLGYRVNEVLDLECIRQLDDPGPNGKLDGYQAAHWGLVERLDAGEWLPHVVTAAVEFPASVALGLSVGRILERAATAGILLVAVRPEYIWVVQDERGPTAVGITGRNSEFFRHTGGQCSIPALPFERHYFAPEVYRDQTASPESLVFTLATMIAEWATGAYPFPDAWAGGSMTSLLQGRHAPLDVPAPLANLLTLALKPEPAHRPSLPYFLRRLSLLTPEQLAS